MLGGFSHRFTSHFQPISTVDETIKNGVFKGGIRKTGMPVLHRRLGSYQGGGPAIAIIDDLQQVASLWSGALERSHRQ